MCKGGDVIRQTHLCSVLEGSSKKLLQQQCDAGSLQAVAASHSALQPESELASLNGTVQHSNQPAAQQRCNSDA